MIARIWRGWVRTDRAAEYVDYIVGTGMAEYRNTPGNRDAQMLTRDLGDGRTEVVTMSWWDSLDSIRAFAGDDITAAKYYPEDEDFLIAHEDTVTHYEVRDPA
jgi:heme-degrading monooxygenase HmoA